MKSKILEAYNVDKKTVTTARALVSDIKQRKEQLQSIERELKKIIRDRANQISEKTELEKRYADGIFKDKNHLETLASDIHNLDKKIAELWDEQAKLLEQLKRKFSDLKTIGEELRLTFINAMNDAVEKRDEYFKYAKAYDNELLRIKDIVNEAGIFKKIFCFKKELPGGNQRSTLQDFEQWIANPYPELEIDE